MPTKLTTITLEGRLNSVLIKDTNFSINRDFKCKLRKLERKKLSTDEKNKFHENKI